MSERPLVAHPASLRSVSPSAVAPPAEDVDSALQVLAAGSRSFHFASLFLPADRRADAALLYSLCRYIDDLADDAPDADTARTDLAALDAELRGQSAPRPLVVAIRELAERRGVDLEHAHHLIEGVCGDLGVVRLADDAALVRYGYQVAGTVGLMMCGVLGVTNPRALPFAIDLGVAMQITNICRDVRADAEMGRVYLPATRLTSLGVVASPEGVLGSREPVRRVVHDLLGMADRYYRSAEGGMHHIPWRARMAIVVAARVYRRIGRRLLRLGGDPLVGRTVVPLGEKLWTALGALFAFRNISRRRATHRPPLHRALADLPGADPHALG